MNVIKNQHWFFSCIFTFFGMQILGNPHPICFGIPEEKIVDVVPTKTQDFASLIPGKLDTYTFNDEATYYADYQQSYFAVTCKKGGWDCLRHYEILANGCIPYFIDLDKCSVNTMHLLPRELIAEAMNLEGVGYLTIDHSRFDKVKYYEILNKLLEYTRKNLTTRAIADYILKKINYTGSGSILFLSHDIDPDYMRCLSLIGLKQLLPRRIIDVPHIPHIYKNYDGDVRKIYGKGFTYSKILEDLPTDRSRIEERIKNKEFDCIIYGSVHRGLRFHDLVKQYYEPHEIVYICGEDAHKCPHVNLPTFFLREFD